MRLLLGVLKITTLIVFGGMVFLTVFAYLNLPLPWKPLVVMSGSMTPAIKTGSLVLVNQKASGYAKNDIITFKSEKELVSHRIYDSSNIDGAIYYQTKGDANNDVDPALVAKKDVVGKVVLDVPYLGKLVNFVKTPLGFILLITVPILFIIISEILVIIDEIRKKGTGKTSNLEFAKPIAMFFVAAVFLTGTHAFFSNVATSSNNTFTAAADFSKLKINEFVANPGTTFTTEWVEIYNFGSNAVNLTGWYIQDAITTTHSLTSLGTVAPGAFVVLDIAEGFLNNSSPGDSVFLKNPSNVVVDSTLYSSTQVDDISRGRDTDGSGAFKTCGLPTKGTTNNGSC